MADAATEERRLSGMFLFAAPSGTEAVARFSMVVDLIDGWTDEGVQAYLEGHYKGFALEGSIKWKMGKVKDWWDGFHPDCRWGRDKINLPMLGVCKCPDCNAADEEIIRETCPERRVEMWMLREEKIRGLRQWM